MESSSINDDLYNIIQPIILCGGSGTRLWPLSTPKIPKQFISLGNKGTLLEETIRRIKLVEKKCIEKNYKIYDPILIMHKDHLLSDELLKYEKNVIYEEYANDTAVAMARASVEIKNKYKNKKIIILGMPADHYIGNVDAFVYDISQGLFLINDDNIILFGIQPTSPNTNYGYIIPGTHDQKSRNEFNTQKPQIHFREKPDLTTALELVKQGALWNSGIFAGNNDIILKCLQQSPYNIMDWLENPKIGKAPSFDIVVLQEYSKICAHYCLEWNWSDIGSFKSFMNTPEIESEIKLNNASSIIISDCSNIDVLNRTLGKIVVIGCENLLIVRNGEDLLIMPNNKNYDNKLKEIATQIYK